MSSGTLGGTMVNWEPQTFGTSGRGLRSWNLPPVATSPELNEWLYRQAEFEVTVARLATEWRRATAVMSSSAQRTEHPTFAQLVALGAKALPIFIEQLAYGEYVWLEVVAALAGEEAPNLSTDELGSRAAAAHAWVNWWGQRNLS